MKAARVEKLNRLREALRDTGGCAVAYSGGVDSSLVLAVAHEMLGHRCLAVIATSPTYPHRERDAAVAWAREQRIPYVVIESDELEIPGFRHNPPDRCYYCKRELFTRVRAEAEARGFSAVADGTNADDSRDWRPGMRAAQELGVLSPLKEAGLTKADIRALAHEFYHLPMAHKPAMACLASRFPYGSTITGEKLAQVEAVEDHLVRRGFRVFRARHHGQVLRLELGPAEMRRIQEPELRAEVVRLAKAQGFAYVTVDLEGYRTGSMNEPFRQPAAAAVAGERRSDG